MSATFVPESKMSAIMTAENVQKSKSEQVENKQSEKIVPKSDTQEQVSSSSGKMSIMQRALER